MKTSLLLIAVTLTCSATLFGQQDPKKTTANFDSQWMNHLLPKSPYRIYHGKQKAYFINSAGVRIPNHSYIDIKSGGEAHFIVQDETGFHILDSELNPVSTKPYESIELIAGTDLELTLNGEKSYYAWNHDLAAYTFSDEMGPLPPMKMPNSPSHNHELGKVEDARFKAKRIEQLRLGIDMSKTLTVGQKGKNVLVLKNEEVVFKGAEKPMLFYDFMITNSSAPHAIYHPTSKDPILENCERFWCVDSFLVVAIKGTEEKYVVSNSGKIILSSVGEVRYYDYEYGGARYSFFCDGISLVNRSGNVLYRSNGELFGVGEHYIYAGFSGGYLGDLTREIKMNFTNFERFGTITIGQTGRNEYRMMSPESTLLNAFDDYIFQTSDSVLVCLSKTATYVYNPYEGVPIVKYPFQVAAKSTGNGYRWKYFLQRTDNDKMIREGRFEPYEGMVIQPKYLKIEWPVYENYYIILHDSGKFRYLDADGRELFD